MNGFQECKHRSAEAKLCCLQCDACGHCGPDGPEKLEFLIEALNIKCV